ncbi:MAG: pantetheine-phosphate adenylyltransferase [Kiritimatiellae bacterium]|nr:pantetheine-phosphate adenylyltransferase [Kiritimatiellia bacterium]
MNSLAIYAGTFDPITFGHLDLVGRAAKTFDRLILSVAASRGKGTLFTTEERVALVREVVSVFPNVEVDSFDGLLVDHVRERGARVIIRGLRAFSDFEFEFQMTLTNRRMAPDVETIFLMPKEEYSYISSSSVREIAAMGGNAGLFVPPSVASALEKKIRATEKP